MRARGIMIVTMIAAVGTSCSTESAPAGDATSDTNQPRTLSLPDESPAGDAVVSDLESGIAPEVASVQSVDVATQNVQEPTPRVSQEMSPAPAIPDVNAVVVSWEPTRLAVPRITLRRPQPAEAVAAGAPEANEPSSVGGDGGFDRPGRGVIIRGGVTAEDDCKLHMPPRAGELINRQGPRVGLPPIRGGGIR